MNERAENYLWWIESGGSWKQEVEARRRYMPIYHLQEILLTHYLWRCAPARVLEFGCGFGRHLRYLREIPDLAVYGYDQSSAMTAQIDWAPAEWLTEHVRTGDALSQLPFENGEFDVVFTVSVLIHIRPEHLQSVLRELLRVSRHQVLHVENRVTDRVTLTSSAHDGCWAHDLVGSYRELGRDASVLPKPFQLQDVYRVIVDRRRRIPEIDPKLAAQLLELDQTLSAELLRLRGIEAREHRRTTDLEAQIAQLRELRDRLREEAQRLVTRVQEANSQIKKVEEKRRRAVDRAERAERAESLAAERARSAEAARTELLERTRATAAEALERARTAERRRAEAIGALEADLASAETRAQRAERALAATHRALDAEHGHRKEAEHRAEELRRQLSRERERVQQIRRRLANMLKT